MRSGWLLGVGLFLCGSCDRAPEPADPPTSARSQNTALQAVLTDLASQPLPSCDVNYSCFARKGGEGGAIQHAGTTRTDSRAHVQIEIPAEFVGLAVQVGFTVARGEASLRCLRSISLIDGECFVDLGRLALADEREPRMPQAEELDDDALERRARDAVETWLGKSQSELEELLPVVREISRRGGARWVGVLAGLMDDLRERRDDDELAAPDFGQLELLLLLARGEAEGGPPLARVLVHPDECDGKPRESFAMLEFEVANLRSELPLAFQPGVNRACVVVHDSAGSPVPRKSAGTITDGGMWETHPVDRSDTTRFKGLLDWWPAFVEPQYELGEGDWTVRVLYAPFHNIVGRPLVEAWPILESDPFVVRIRKNE